MPSQLAIPSKAGLIVPSQAALIAVRIPPQSFSATDIVIVAGLTRPLGSHRQVRRIVEISELDKGTLEFRPLMVFDEQRDLLVTTDALKTSDRIRTIASSWGLTVREAFENIGVRKEIRRALVEASRGGPDGGSFLSAEWVCRSNNSFWREVEEHGRDYEAVISGWREWFARASGTG